MPRDAIGLPWMKPEKLGETRPRALTEVEAVGIVSRWFAERNNELQEDHLHDPTDSEVIPEQIEGTEYAISMPRAVWLRMISPITASFARNGAAGGRSEGRSRIQGYRALLQLLVRANKELSLIDLARLWVTSAIGHAEPKHMPSHRYATAIQD